MRARTADQYITSLRVLASIGIITSYIFTYYIDSFIGACLALGSNLCSLPFTIRNKYWDVVVVLSFVIVITLTKIVTDLK